MEKLESEGQFSLKITLDRNRAAPIIKYSKQAGMSFDTIESTMPNMVFASHIDYANNLSMNELHDIAINLDIGK